MGPASSLIEWLKPDCLFPNKNHRKKKKRSTPPSPPTSTTAARRKPLTLEEHLSSASSAPTGRGVRKPFPKRVHPSSSSSSLSTAGGRKGKGKSNGFTLETLVKLDRESRDDYFSENSSRSNLVVSGDGSGVGSVSGLAAGSRREGKKSGKRVRFTLPGDGDVYVFYSPRAPINRPFTLFETS
ncbi:unnamed protein product [Linum trigynum]|uniref:Uncharacterized protein n=1 Tax=Linum trigynum TaxID=586398 RepID=A0AAV2EJI8_9ROSI